MVASGARRPAPILFAAVLLAAGASAFAADETLRGRFRVEMEPVPSLQDGDPYPLDAKTAHLYALKEAARVFAGMIYGWTFDYDIGDKSRKIAEFFEVSALGAIPFGDPRMRATDAEVEDSFFYLWAEYRLDDAQLRAFTVVREGDAQNAQATGSASVSRGVEGKAAALEDAAREAVRSILRKMERNRPKEARGTVVLTEVPRYWVDAGRYQCAGRFRVTVKEVVPYKYY